MVLDENTPKMNNGSNLSLTDDADKYDKSQITVTYAQLSSGSRCMCSTIRYLQQIPKKLFPAFEFQPRCLLQGTACHVINNIITKWITHYSAPQPMGLSTLEPHCLLQGSACHVINNFICYDIHTRNYQTI